MQVLRKLLMKHHRLPSQTLEALGVPGEQMRHTRRHFIGGCGHTSATVGGTAAICAALSVEPIPAKSVAAAAIVSGATITYDIPHLPARPSMCIPFEIGMSSGPTTFGVGLPEHGQPVQVPIPPGESPTRLRN